jgi:hypothetical protein
VMHEHGQSTPRYEAMAQRAARETAFARMLRRSAWRRGEAGRGPGLAAHDDADSPDDHAPTT